MSTPLPRGPVRIYKNREAGRPRKAPRCVCCFPQSRAGQVVPLRYGVQLVLCEDHRDPEWITAASGRFFLASVAETFRSLGLTGRRYGRALRAFVEDARQRSLPAPRRRPGSYTWPDLRERAEQVWAEGGAYHDGEQALLAVVAAERAPDWPMPSPHTVRRWWREKRWLFGNRESAGQTDRAVTTSTSAVRGPGDGRSQRLARSPRSATLAQWLRRSPPDARGSIPRRASPVAAT